MRTKIALIAGALALGVAAPASANEFGGLYASATAGVQDVTQVPTADDIVYGANAGVNIPLGDAIVGLEATADNVFEDTREIGASARLGYTFDDVMLYGVACFTTSATTLLCRLNTGTRTSKLALENTLDLLASVSAFKSATTCVWERGLFSPLSFVQYPRNQFGLLHRYL